MVDHSSAGDPAATAPGGAGAPRRARAVLGLLVVLAAFLLPSFLGRAHALPVAATVATQTPATASGSGLSSVDAVVLGVVEGITEYLPISSTGHLTVTQKLLD